VAALANTNVRPEDAGIGDAVGRLCVHDGHVCSVAWASDGTGLVACCRDMTVVISHLCGENLPSSLHITMSSLPLTFGWPTWKIHLEQLYHSPMRPCHRSTVCGIRRTPLLILFLDDHTPLSRVVSLSGKHPIESLVESLHPNLRLSATQVSRRPSLHQLGYPDRNTHVSDSAPLRMGATKFVFGGLPLHPRAKFRPYHRLDLDRC
jgi:hypothetical protein